MPLAAAPCATCNDQGAVGNILNAEPCPDCTPAPTSHPIPTGATGEGERKAFEAWAGNKGWPLSPYQNNCGIVVAERYGHRTVQKAWEAWQERAAVDAPAAGDALRLALEALEAAQPIMKHYTEPNERHQRAIEAVRAAIAQQKGEA